MMNTIVLMVAIGWAPQADGTLKAVWRFEKQVPVRECLQMQSVFAGGGRAGAITVRCGDFKTIDAITARKARL